MGLVVREEVYRLRALKMYMMYMMLIKLKVKYYILLTSPVVAEYPVTPTLIGNLDSKGL